MLAKADVLAWPRRLQLELDRRLRIPLWSVKLFILSVRARMVGNAYHNWNHVVDVTQVRRTARSTLHPLHCAAAPVGSSHESARLGLWV